MKTYRLFFLLCSLLFVATACDDENETQEPVVRFPETQIVNCNVGEQHTISFEAQSAWKLSSSANWCRFVEGDRLEYSTSGTAGKSQVTIEVSDEGQKHDALTKAQLTIHIDGQTGVLAEVLRSAAGYELQVYDMDGNPIDEIKVGYSDYLPFQVKANYAFTATSKSEWAELRGNTMSGAANMMTEGGIRVIADGNAEKNECVGSITFQDINGMAAKTIRLTYDGMDRNAVNIQLPEGNQWNWIINAEGNTWTHNSITYDRFVACNIAAYHDAYEVVYVEESDNTFAIASTPWMHLDKKTGRVTVDASEEARRGYIFVFPLAVYDEIKGDLIGNIVNSENGEQSINYRYQNMYMLMQLRQQAPKTEEGGSMTGSEVGFIASFYDENWAPCSHNCYRITDKATLDHYEPLIGTRNLYLLDKPSARFNGNFDEVIPYPILDFDQWSDNLTYFTDENGVQLDDVPEVESHGGHIVNDEDAEPLPDHWYVGGCTNTRDNKIVILVIQNLDGSIMKALLINTKNDE